MRPFARTPSVLVCSFVVLAIGSLLSTAPVQGQRGRSGPPAQDVRVINGASDPVPVDGRVQVTGTPEVSVTNRPAVDAAQAGEWTVGVSGTPAVKLDGSGNAVRVVNSAPIPITPVGTTSVAGSVVVANGDSSPIPVRPPDRQPVQGRAVLLLEPGGPGRVQEFLSFTLPDGTTTSGVPLGKRLVIEQVTGQIELLGDEQALATLATAVNREVVRHFLAFEHRADFPAGPGITNKIFNLTEHVRLYAGPGTLVSTALDRATTTGSGRYQLTLSGFLESVE